MLKSLFSVLLLGVLCCFSSEAQAQGGIRFVHASPQIDAVDFFLNENLGLFEAVEPFNSSGVRTEFPPLQYSTSVKLAGTADPVVASGSATTAANEITTVALLGETGSATLLPMQWDMETPPQGSIRIRLVHASPDEAGSIDAFLDNTRFLENVAQYDASGFTEVPIEQSEQIEIRNRNGLLIGKFNGQFDPGNSYSLFFSTREGQPVMHVLFENSLDPQLPLTEAESLGSLVPMRVVNVATETPMSYWTIGGQELAEPTGLLSASATQRFLLSDESAAVGFAADEGGELLDESNIGLPTQDAFAMFAVGTKGQETLVEGVLPVDPPASGQTAIRFLNALPAGQVNIVLNKELGIQPNLGAKALSGYTEIESQVATFSVFSSATQDLLAEGRVSLESGRSYTVIVVNPDAGVQIRLLDESDAAAQNPMRIADVVVAGSGLFRAANLMAGDESALTFANDGNTINASMGVNSASEIVRDLPEGKEFVQLFGLDDPEVALTSDSVEILNDVTTLCVAYGADNENAMLAWTNETAERGDAGSVNIRVFSALDDDETMSLWSSVANRNVINGIDYGEFTSYTSVEYDPAIEFSLRKGATQIYNFALTEDYRRNMTFFVTTFESQITVFVLKEDEEGPQDPLMPTENLGIQSVEELARVYGFSATLSNEMVDEEVVVQYSTDIPVSVTADIVTAQGQVLSQHSHASDVASEVTQTMYVSALPPGMYLLRLIVNDQMVGLPFIKR